MNTTDGIMELADDYADWAVDKSKTHPSTAEAREALRTAIEQLVAQAAWTHHTPALLSDADAAADLAGVARPGAEPVVHPFIAGALFDFMGWLTSRKERLVLSSTDDASPAAEAVTAFAKMRGLSLDDAKVQDWNTAPPQASQPLTDEQIEDIIARHDYRLHGDRPRYIARATEAAHGIGAAQQGQP